MQRHLSPRFKTKYLGPGKVDTFIDLMSFFTSSTVPVPTTRHGFSGTRPGQSNTGFTGLFLTGSPGYGKANEQGVRVRLSASELQKLGNEIQRSPRELGYDQNLWDGVLLSHHLAKDYSVSFSVRQCQRLFHQLGFSLQRPRRQASEADPLQQEAFKKTSTDG
jgi:hypothetical protein